VRLLTVVVVHDRYELTKRTIDSWIDTTDEMIGRCRLVIVDSGSTDPELCDWLEWMELAGWAVLMMENVYPGKACNVGWRVGLEGFDASLLHRSDNDVVYEPGWVQHVEACFDAYAELGQLGVLDMRDEPRNDWFRQLEHLEGAPWLNVGWPTIGGNCVIRRSLWDRGLRWDERPWPALPEGEDSLLSREVRKLGWRTAHVHDRIATHIGHEWSDAPAYYARSALERGLSPHWLRQHFADCLERERA
jgi:hypothetical protein